jgi:O-acetyl-ADP-ribose deacetylase (regulator of RNase III)
MKIDIFTGDALAVTGVPALVVPANKQLTLSWGSHVAAAVRKRAGREVEAEALAAHPGGIALGEAVLTRAGKLATFTHLIHAAVLDAYDWSPLFLLRLKERTSRATLAAATRASLEVARRAGLTGLVLTPMGAGIGGMKDAVCARIMIDEIQARPIERVVIACWKERTSAAFRAALA